MFFGILFLCLRQILWNTVITVGIGVVFIKKIVTVCDKNE